jgi:hypothetical protein
LQLRIFGEDGTDDYFAVSDAPDRGDGVRSYGADVSIEPGRRVALRLIAYRTRFDSNLPGFDRELTDVILSMTLGSTTIVAR